MLACESSSNTVRTCDVKACNPDYEAMVIPIVDAAVQYDCPFTGNIYILVLRNALYVPAMDNHLIPPFIMREASITVTQRRRYILMTHQYLTIV